MTISIRMPGSRMLVAMRWYVAVAALAPLLVAQDQQTRPLVTRFTAHGQVMIEGFGPAPAAVVILSCGGSVRANEEGKFSALGTVSSSNIRCDVEIQQTGCEPRGVTLTSPAASVALGVITLKPWQGKQNAGLVSFHSMAAPEAARKLHDQARKSLSRKKWDDAERDLKKALQVYDRDPEAWYELGLIRKEKGDEPRASEAFSRARSIDAKYLPSASQLQTLALRRQDWGTVTGLGEEIVASNPVDFPETWLYLSMARLKTGDAAGAETAARKALETSEKKPLVKAHHLLGVALAQQKRNKEAATELRLYVEKAPNAPDAATVREHLKLVEAQQR